MKKYFLHNGADQQGPFDIDDLKTKNISRETPIWFDGISEWTIAGKIEELKPLFATIPPPFSTSNSTPPPIHKTEPKNKVTYYQPEKKKSNSVKYALFLGCLLVLGGGGLFIANQNNSSKGRNYETPAETYQEKVMTVEEIENSQPTNFLTADGYYNENFLGNN
jgi:hypothetical protein